MSLSFEVVQAVRPESSSQIQTCPDQLRCSGCSHLGLSLADQKKIKLEKFTALAMEGKVKLPEVEFESVGDFGLRDRMDFVFEKDRWGLYSPDRQEVTDLVTCGQLSRELQDFYSEFRQIRWPIQKGSFRLRTGPQGKRGVWLDFANVDIRDLLQDESWLRELQKFTTKIEVGQKQKLLKDIEGKLKLVDPELDTWFEGWIDGKVQSLYSFISSFTQPSRRANIHLGKILKNHYHNRHWDHALEFGAGIGNLGLSLWAVAKTWTFLEFEGNAITALEKNLQKLKNYHPENVEIFRGDFRRRLNLEKKSPQFLVMNPPRSGGGEFLQSFSFLKELEEVFLMSCFPKTWVEDSVRLQQQGFDLNRVVLFDQFPQTSHVEILSFFHRSRS